MARKPRRNRPPSAAKTSTSLNLTCAIHRHAATRGLSAEEAFLVAANRIGKGSALESEFGKVNGQAIWLDRLFWMLIGYQVWGFVSGTIGLVTRNALSSG